MYVKEREGERRLCILTYTIDSTENYKKENKKRHQRKNKEELVNFVIIMTIKR